MNRLTHKILTWTTLASMMIPRAGTKLGEIPITLPIIMYAVLFLLWICRPASGFRFKLRGRGLWEDIAVFGTVGFLLLGLVSIAIGFIRAPEIKQLILEASSLVGFVPMFFIVREHLQSREAVRGLIRVVVIAALVVSLYGIVQKAVGHNRTMIPGITISYADSQESDPFEGKNNLTAVGLKTVSTFQNGNLYGNFLVLVLPLTIALASVSRGKARRRYFWLSMLVLGNLVLTLSRGAILAGMISMCLAAWYLRPAKMPIYVASVFILVGAVLVVALGMSDRLLHYDATGAGRTLLWAEVTRIYAEMPAGAFALTTSVGAGMGGTLGPPRTYIVQTEGSLIIMAMKMGLVGLFAFLASVYGAFRAALFARKRPIDLEGAAALGLGVGLVGATLQFAMDSVMLMPPTAMNFWIAAGLCVAASSVVRRRELDGVNQGA